MGGVTVGPVPAAVRVSETPGRVMRSATGEVASPTLTRQRTTTPSSGATTPPRAWLNGGRTECATVQFGVHAKPLVGTPSSLLPIVVAAKASLGAASASPATESNEARPILRPIPAPFPTDSVRSVRGMSRDALNAKKPRSPGGLSVLRPARLRLCFTRHPGGLSQSYHGARAPSIRETSFLPAIIDAGSASSSARTAALALEGCVHNHRFSSR